jgi:hypothetical protein
MDERKVLPLNNLWHLVVVDSCMFDEWLVWNEVGVKMWC